MSAVRVTLALCTWNRCALLQRTLEQLTALVIPPGVEWQLLVINNACSDATDDVAASFLHRLPLRLLSEPRPGQAHARNLAVREATGEYLLWTDDDVLVDEHWLAAILDAFRQYDADFVFGRAEPHWPGPVPDWFSPRHNGLFALLDYGGEPFVVKHRDQPFYGLNFASRREAQLRLGDFRVDYGIKGRNRGGVGEDADMFERALAARLRVVYAPAAIVRHIIPPKRATRQFQRWKTAVGTEDFYLFLKEKPPAVPWLVGLPRYFYAKVIEDIGAYVKSIWASDKGEAFYRELQVIRFAGLVYQACRYQIQAMRSRLARAT